MMLTASVFFSASAFAMDSSECPTAAPKGSPELEQIKSLAGKWQGIATPHGNAKAESAAVEYKVTSGGSAVVETLFPGTPHEMVSVYHDKNGKLSMTHYCMLGNQPELELKSAAGGKMQFAESDKSLAGQPHMDSLTLDQSKPGELVQTWGGVGPDGKSEEPTVITLKKAS